MQMKSHLEDMELGRGNYELLTEHLKVNVFPVAYTR